MGDSPALNWSLRQPRAKAVVEAAAREAEGKPPAKVDPLDAVPDPKARRNFTDPESKMMKTSSKSVRD